MFTIGEVAERVGISTHTLRYYEKESIITPDRAASGDRRYTEAHLKWLRFVIRLKETQMPIEKIKQYASLVAQGEHTAEERLTLLEEHRRSITRQLETLQAAEKMLEHKIAAYQDAIRNRA